MDRSADESTSYACRIVCLRLLFPDTLSMVKPILPSEGETDSFWDRGKGGGDLSKAGAAAGPQLPLPVREDAPGGGRRGDGGAWGTK